MIPPAAPAWHAVSAREAVDLLHGGHDGLSTAEAGRRLARWGPNTLPRRSPPPLWRLAEQQLANPLVLLLVAAAAVSLAIGHGGDALLVALVIVLDATIGTWQESRARRSIASLETLLRTRAAVCRDGTVRDVAAEEVVPGDVIWLDAGDRVPADARLVTAHALEVDESLLTGESVPVAKDPAWTGPRDCPLADRTNMVHAGSIVTRGRASAVAVATGIRTELGAVAIDVAAPASGTPPLVARMRRFTRTVAVAVVVAAAVVALLGIAIGRHPAEMFPFAVVLAVSAIPEGLPVSLTIALAVAAGRMAARGVVVRWLPAVEGLGSCTFIATDKTGTLTCNELTVTAIDVADREGEPLASLDVTGRGFVPEGDVRHAGRRIALPANPGDRLGIRLADLVRAAVLCNDAALHRRDGGWTWRGDPVDVALLSLGGKIGVEREHLLTAEPQFDEMPFDADRRFAATFHDASEGRFVCLKGAPEAVLPMCGRNAMESAWHERAASLAAAGLRVLAIAHGTLESPAMPQRPPTLPARLEFLGLVGLSDPLRPGARRAVASCADAGIRVVMVTGDHQLTARTIATEIGLVHSATDVVTGAELAALSREDLVAVVRTARVFARVTPRQKREIVEAARAVGHYVAVTGDGVNDVPALRAANIGVAMGKQGTDVARAAAGLVIVDDDFSTIVAGIREGRVAYDNVRKVVLLLMSTGAAEMLLAVLAVAAGLPLPLTTAQLLWLNLVTSGVQDVALAFGVGDGDELARPPRPPAEAVFDRLMVERVAITAVVMGLAAFAVFRLWLAAAPADGADGVARARNATLLVMVLFENMHLLNCRSERRSALVRPSVGRRASPILVVGTLAALALHVLAMHWGPAQAVLGVAPLAARDWLALVAVAAAVVPAVECHKWWCRRRDAVRESVA